jgi:hypothetical protein
MVEVEQAAAELEEVRELGKGVVKVEERGAVVAKRAVVVMAVAAAREAAALAAAGWEAAAVAGTALARGAQGSAEAA